MVRKLRARIEGKAPESHEKLRGSGQVSADIFNLSDMRQVMKAARSIFRKMVDMNYFILPKMVSACLPP